MSYTDPIVDLSAPTGSSAAKNAWSDIIATRRMFKERLADVLGADLDHDPNVPTKYGANVNINESQVRGSVEFDNGNSGVSKAIDWDNGNYQKLTATGNCTVSFSNLRATATILLRIMTSSGYTFTWPASVKWSGGSIPTLAGTMLIQFYTPDGTTVYGAVAATNAS